MQLPTSLELLVHDVQYALRRTTQNPGFTATAVLLLSLTIGANTAIFSLLNAVMFHLLPVRHPEQLVELLSVYPGEPPGSWFSLESYKHFRDKNHAFSGLIGTASFNPEVSGKGMTPGIAEARYVTGNFFEVLGLTPARGRFISPADDRTSAPAAVLSWSYWNSQFHQDPAILGEQIEIDHLPVSIIGIAPRNFLGLQVGVSPDLWVSASLAPAITQAGHTNGRPPSLALMARLKPNISLQQAQAEMTVLDRWRIEDLASKSKDPQLRQIKIEVEPASAGFSLLRNRFSKPLVLLMALVGFLLLLACTSLAAMLLAHGAARQSEMALRVCLGAGRFRLMRQVLLESLLLSSLGTLCGILFAYILTGFLVRLVESGRHSPGLPAHLEIHVQPDLHLLVFTIGAALLTGCLFGLVPAWNAFASSPASSLRTIGNTSETKSQRLLGRALVAAQIAFSVTLLSTAALFIHNLANLDHLNLGFRRDHILLVKLDRASTPSSPAPWARTYMELLARLNALSGIRSATLSAPTPISGAGASRFANVEGYPNDPQRRRYLSVSWIAPRYFETLRIPLLAGRDFIDNDHSNVAIVNQAVVDNYFAGNNPTGKHLTFLDDHKSYEIIGVVGNTNYYEIREPKLNIIYLNAYQQTSPPSNLVLWTATSPLAATNEVTQTVNMLLHNTRVTGLTALSAQIDASILPERLIAALSSLFGLFGAIIAATGLHGLLAYTVARRTNEIGIRLALGATVSTVITMVLKDALLMVGIGLAIGIPLAYCGMGFATSLIEGLPIQSAVPILSGIVGVIFIALLAAYLPARRASRVDPIAALRHE